MYLGVFGSSPRVRRRAATAAYTESWLTTTSLQTRSKQLLDADDLACALGKANQQLHRLGLELDGVSSLTNLIQRRDPRASQRFGARNGLRLIRDIA